jgi:hypothetical protein
MPLLLLKLSAKIFALTSKIALIKANNNFPDELAI